LQRSIDAQAKRRADGRQQRVHTAGVIRAVYRVSWLLARSITREA